MDLSLVIRPFGVGKLNRSVEEALDFFVKPETLSGYDKVCDSSPPCLSPALPVCLCVWNILSSALCDDPLLFGMFCARTTSPCVSVRVLSPSFPCSTHLLCMCVCPRAGGVRQLLQEDGLGEGPPPGRAA